MIIAFSTIYGDAYTKDRLFNNSACNIGENLLMPNIMLKADLERKGCLVHTIDMVTVYDKVIFQEIPTDSWLTISNWVDRIKYILKRKWRRDYFYKAVKKLSRDRLFLQINEPPTVAPQSYERKYHKYFGKVLTWHDDLVDGDKYIKFYIPQYWNGSIYSYPYSEKSDFVMICGNKSSKHKNELYSKRREIIKFFEKNTDKKFDLYGFGWKSEKFRNYKGTVEKKLEIMSKYKFCFCLENIYDINGYITEKIFDCFFSGVVPIYMGAKNISKYIPLNTFINLEEFEDIDAIIEYCEKMDEKTYLQYLDNANLYLNSNMFKDSFSVEKYINVIENTILED